jgi:hypothetical protein
MAPKSPVITDDIIDDGDDDPCNFKEYVMMMP